MDVRALSAPASCPNCGTALASDTRFCPTCGKATAQIQPGACPKCGAGKVESHNYCPSCGFPLIPALRASEGQRQTTALSAIYRQSDSTVGSSQVPPAYQRDRDFQEVTDIGRTSNGLLLLAISSLLDPIPYVNYLSGLLALVGAVLMILGRRAFGDAHSRNVVLSVVLYVIGLVIGILVALSFAFSVAEFQISGASGSSAAGALSVAFNDLLVGLIITEAVIGIAIIVFTYAIQDRLGRVLLLAGYISSLSVGIFILSVISAQVTTALQSAGLSSAVSSLQSQAQLLRLLGFIPGIIYATAYYRVRERIDRGELPTRL